MKNKKEKMLMLSPFDIERFYTGPASIPAKQMFEKVFIYRPYDEDIQHWFKTTLHNYDVAINYSEYLIQFEDNAGAMEFKLRFC